MIDTLKIWIFYLKGEKPLYAYTGDKKFKKRFLEERNPNCFNVMKIEIDELEFSIFSSMHHSHMLCEYPLPTSIEDYVNILMTPHEYANLCAQATFIENEVERIYKEFQDNVDLKGKYQSALDYLCNITYNKKYPNGETVKMSSINLLYLFTTQFKNTLEVNKDE